MLLRIFVDNMNYFNHGIYHKILYLIRSALWHRGGYVNRGRKNIFSQTRKGAEDYHPANYTQPFCRHVLILNRWRP